MMIWQLFFEPEDFLQEIICSSLIHPERLSSHSGSWCHSFQKQLVRRRACCFLKLLCFMSFIRNLSQTCLHIDEPWAGFGRTVPAAVNGTKRRWKLSVGGKGQCNMKRDEIWNLFTYPCIQTPSIIPPFYPPTHPSIQPASQPASPPDCKSSPFHSSVHVFRH